MSARPPFLLIAHSLLAGALAALAVNVAWFAATGDLPSVLVSVVATEAVAAVWSIGQVARFRRKWQTALAATATPDEKFFVPGRTYTRTLRTGVHLRFECVSLTSDPKIGDREAWGWVRRSNGTRCRDFLFDHDFPLWTPEAGDR